MVDIERQNGSNRVENAAGNDASREFRSALAVVGVETTREAPSGALRLRRGKTTPFGQSSKLALERSLEQATSRGDRRINTTHLARPPSEPKRARRRACCENTEQAPNMFERNLRYVMMVSMQYIDTADRRARLARHHHLVAASRAVDVVALSESLCGLHATDPVSVFLAARSRLVDFVPDDLEQAMYEDRSLIRMLGMRRTVFVVPTEAAPVVHQACTAKIARANRRRLLKLIVAYGISRDSERWLTSLEDDVVAALRELDDATAVELSERVPGLRTKLSMATGKSYGADVSINNQVLTQLAADGRIVRGRPTAAWSSTRYRWAPIEKWTATVPIDGISEVDAETELARRWLSVFGPATEADLKWWAGWTLTQTRRALAGIGAVEVSLDVGTGWVLPGDLDPVAITNQWVALLPALDPTPMGWADRDWYLGSHRDRLFDRTGNIGPTIWVDGRIVGGWSQRATGEIATELLEDVGSDAAEQIGEEAGRLEVWLGDVRFKPRFPTPLQKDLAS